METHILQLECLERAGRALERRLGIAKNVGAERAAERIRVGRGGNPLDDVALVAVGHFVRRQQRDLRLARQAGRAAVGREPAAGPWRADPVGIVEQVGVGRRELLVA